MYKIIIRNGTIIDGTGKPMFRGDVGVRGDRIDQVGDLQNEAAEKIIDARGKFVSPGFIDVNNRSDFFWQLFLEPELKSLVYQGITTIVGGSCGVSLAPLSGQEAAGAIREWNGAEGINLDWSGTDDFLEAVEKARLSVNFGTLVGHRTVRNNITGWLEREMTEREVKTAQKMVSRALKEGALGVSFGPDRFHSRKKYPAETAALAHMASKEDRICCVHLENEGENLAADLGSVIEAARTSGARFHISHFKALGEKNWNIQEEALALLDQAGQNGADISFDLYPYIFASVSLAELLPSWMAEGGKKVMLARLKDTESRKKVAEEMRKKGQDYSKVIVGVHSIGRNVKRKKVSELAVSLKKTPEDVLLDILAGSGGAARVMLDALSEENLERALAHPLSIISSSSSGYGSDYQKMGDLVHPRSFGTFPRVLARYVREKKILTWEQAIRKMTGKPAERLGISDRGTIQKGRMADFIVFDPEKIVDRSSEDDPFCYAEGVEWVVVNGEIILQEGAYNGRRVGRVIRKEKRFFS